MTVVLALLLGGFGFAAPPDSALNAGPAEAVLGAETALDPAPADCPGGQRLDRAALDAAGVTHLSSLYRLLDGLRTTTVDGFSWQPTHTSGVPFDGDAFTVLVDGEAQPLGLFGEQDVELLTVPTTGIEAVVFCPAPGLAGGRWASGGTLYIETITAAEGTAGRAALQIGNETGDPGPYRYTDRGTRNVDKSGPDGEGALTYRAEDLAGRLALRIYRFYPTDPAQIGRTSPATTRTFPGQRLLLGALDGSAEALGGTHRATAAARYVSDFRFTEAAGRELPTRRLDARLGLRGTLPLGAVSPGPLTLGYRVGLDLQTLDDEDSALPSFEPGWRRTTGTASLEGRLGTQTQRLAFGATLDRTTAEGPGLPGGAGFTLATLYLRREAPGRLLCQTDLALVTAGRRARLKLAQTVGGRLAGQPLALVLALDGRLPEEDPRYGYWAAQGYAGLQRQAVTYQPTGPPQPGVEASVRLGWAGAASPHARAEVGVEGRMLRGLYVEQPAFVLVPGEAAAGGTIAAVPGARGEVVGVRAAVEGGRGALKGRLFYSLLTDVGGTRAFREAWARVPPHRAGAALTLRPDPGFSLHAALTAESATRWPGYAALDGAVAPNGYVYADGTPLRLLLDAAIHKGFWDRRVRLSLVFRNLLHTEERYHPLGAALDFRLFARVTAQLNGPFWVQPRAGEAN